MPFDVVHEVETCPSCEHRRLLAVVTYYEDWVKTERGDYRGFYENVRDALLGKAELEVKPEQVWRTTRLIELARESSAQGRRVKVEFSAQP